MHHNRHLVFWLMKTLDHEGLRLRVSEDHYIDMNEQTPGRVLGIRSGGGKNLTRNPKVQLWTIIRLHELFGMPKGTKVPSLSDCERVLGSGYDEVLSKDDEDRFMVALAAVCCAYMFGPGVRQAKIPKDIWEFISNVENLRQCNWSEYVLKVIQECSTSVQMNVLKADTNPNSVKLGGCWLYLEVMIFTQYLHALFIPRL